MSKALIPGRDIFNIIGSICNNPSLYFEDGVNLNEDYFGDKFYKIIYGGINNIIINNTNVEKITAVDIDNEMAKSQKIYNFYENNDGFNFVSSCIDNSNEKLFYSSLLRAKKFAILRDMVDNGIDIKNIYDYSSIDLEKQRKQSEELDLMDINTLLDKPKSRLIDIQNKWSLEETYKSYMINDGLQDLLERLQNKPELGYPYQNPYYNSLFLGMKKKKCVIRSAGTGVGKTRLAAGDICDISCDQIYNMEKKMFNPPNGKVYPTTFISTELEIQELQTLMLAYISGLDEDIIKKGDYSDNVRSRINKAIEILDRAPIHLHYIDDFSLSDIEQIIEKDILDHGVKYVFFDYIQLTPKLSRTMQEDYKSSLREDQILVNLSSRLKLLANKYGVYLSTSTQLNRNAKDHDMRDPSSLRGGSSIADKADIGIMCFNVTNKDIEQLKHILDTTSLLKPNFCHYVYKNRGGKSGFIIWTIINKGNMRETPAFITDMDYNLRTDIPQLSIEFDNNLELELKEIKVNQFGQRL